MRDALGFLSNAVVKGCLAVICYAQKEGLGEGLAMSGILDQCQGMVT